MLKRFDSLFARLLLTQALLALGLSLVFVAVFYTERNVAVARLVAEYWAPALRQAAGLPATEPTTALPVLRRTSEPDITFRSRLLTPRMAAFSEELKRLGVPLQAVAFGRGEAGPTVWLKVSAPNGDVMWLGMEGATLLPRLPWRLVLATGLGVLLLVVASFLFTRWLTRPLEELRGRMQSHRPGVAGAASARAGAMPSPEIAAIDTAYTDLLKRLDGHERERALLLAGVSHDLRSPLARIRLAAALLPEEPATSAAREAIVRNTQVADRLIGSFLDHVRAGELALDEQADLAVLARQAVATLTLDGDAAEVNVQAPASLMLAGTNASLLERLLSNLLDNALKHGHSPVELRVTARGGQAEIDVSDAGPGVPLDQRVAVLEAFSRGDASRGTPGTGLGLAIVARVVGRMGGTIAFDHAGGRHRVRVVLPGVML